MSPITVPLLSLTDMVTETAVLGLVCLGLWCWAIPRLFRSFLLRHTGTPAEPSTAAGRGLLALAISAPIAYYLLWLLTTPPTVISMAGVTGGGGPPYYKPTTIRWRDATTLRCRYIFWQRPRPRFGLSIQSASDEIWIGRMSRYQADKLMEVMQAYVSTGDVKACPEWADFPWSRSTR